MRTSLVVIAACIAVSCGGSDSPSLTITVAKGGNGGGSVISAPAGIDCGSTCTATIEADEVTLVAQPDTGSRFVGWSGGACSGTGPCTVSADASVTATFALDHTLVVAKTGNGSGTVDSNPAGISCGADCGEVYADGTSVTLTATPDTGSFFGGWSGGGCSGNGTCTVSLTDATMVTATFTLQPYTLTVARNGTGTGTVTSVPFGIACGSDCTENYDYGSTVVLTALPDTGSVFAGWQGGGCSGSGTCTTTISAATTVTATFTLTTHTLTVARAGAGSGTVTSTPAGINCGVDCTEDYDYGTVVVLTATPDATSNFAGWSGGGCSGTGTCMTTITAATTVTATFDLTLYTLTVMRNGNGNGTVTSAPAGINCGVDCTEDYVSGTMVDLTASPASDSNFAGWSGGGCSGTGTCTVTVTAAASVSATFTLKQYTLTVARAGTGTGTVTSAPAGINCGVDCTEDYDHGTMVQLTAAAGVNTNFAGWSGGGCTGTGTCTVTMTAAATVTATFNLQTVTITISKLGPGASGARVTGNGLDCGATCSVAVPVGTVVTLAQTPGGSVFQSWSGGGCSGTGGCSFTANANTTITATYRQLKVALEASTGSCLRQATNSMQRLINLLAARGHAATFVQGTDIDTAAEINAFDVVVLPGPGAGGCVAQDFTTYDPVVDAYVKTNGGGVVASGWFLFNNFGATGIVGVLPSTQVSNYFTGNQTVTTVGGSPITAGLSGFNTNQWLPWGGGPRPGATPLLTVGATTVAEAWAQGNGRTAFVGPMFVEDYTAYDNESLLDGTQAQSIEFFARTIEWCGKAR